MKKLSLLCLIVLFVTGILPQLSSVSAKNVKESSLTQVLNREKNLPLAVQKKIAAKQAQLAKKEGQPEKFSLVNQFSKTRIATSATPNLSSGRLALKNVTRSAANADKATIKLEADDVWGDGTGYVLLIGDFDEAEFIGDLFDLLDYSIPVNAVFDYDTPAVVDDIQTIEIPEGTYDFYILNPDPNSEEFWTPGGISGVDDYTFKKGWIYHFVVLFDEVTSGDHVYLSAYNETTGPTPDLSVAEIILPSSACNLSASEQISFVIYNSDPFASSSASFTVEYSINNGTPAVITVNTPLDPLASVTVSPAGTFDFSATATYIISVTVSDVKDTNNDNNTVEKALVSGPLPLPFINHLESEDDLLQFSYNEDDWFYLNFPDWGYKDLTAVGESPLYTHCIDFASGVYKITFGYMAGENYFGYDTDDFDILIGKSGTDISGWETIVSLVDQNTDDEYAVSDATFTLTEAGAYQVAFVPVKLDMLAIESVEIEKIAELGFTTPKNAEIDVYPLNNVLQVKANQLINTIAINDIKGSLVYKSDRLKTDNYSVNIAHLAKGIYTARITTTNETKTVKFIVK